MSRRPECREAVGYCAETCPAVDTIFDVLIADLDALVAEDDRAHAERLVRLACQSVKDRGTLLLRAALESACADKLQAEGERDEFEREVQSLTEKVESLASEVRDLERQLDRQFYGSVA